MCENRSTNIVLSIMCKIVLFTKIVVYPCFFFLNHHIYIYIYNRYNKTKTITHSCMCNSLVLGVILKAKAKSVADICCRSFGSLCWCDTVTPKLMARVKNKNKSGGRHLYYIVCLWIRSENTVLEWDEEKVWPRFQAVIFKDFFFFFFLLPGFNIRI